MKNKGSTTILTNLVGVHLRKIHTKFEANPCSGLREVEKLKKVHADDKDDDDGYCLIARVTLTHWVWLKIILREISSAHIYIPGNYPATCDNYKDNFGVVKNKRFVMH